MTDIHDLKIGAPGPFLPPWDNVLKNAKTIDSLGYDSMAFPDHFAGFVPESIWTPDITPLAVFQQSPHTYYELSGIMSACAAVTEHVQLISSVTEPIRRHPILIAQTFLTLDHISRGRAVLGIGAGEFENIEPYGLNYSGQVGKLREALEIIKMAWNTHEPFSYDGRYWKLKDAVIWIAAMGPKMLKLAAEYGDGWIPSVSTLKEYGAGLRTIHEHRKKLDRTGPFTAALWKWCIIDDDPMECERLMKTPLARAFALMSPARDWTRLGYSHPFGDDFHWVTNYVPMRYDRKTTLDAIEKVPLELLQEFYMAGDKETLIGILEDLVKQGLEHVILWNATGMFDLEKTKPSYNTIKEILAYVKG